MRTAVWLAIGVVIGSHAYMLMFPKNPISSMEVHACANIIAGLVVAAHVASCGTPR